MVSKKAKIIGISKVNIPTLVHPKVPYFVLVLEDENGNKWAQKSIKEYKIGEELKYDTSLDSKAVAIWRVKYDLMEAMEKIIELLGGINFKKEAKILILPTLVSPKHPYFRENTSPLMLNTLVEILLEKGIESSNITVAAQSFTEIPIEASAQKSGLVSICLKKKINPLDLAKSNFSRREGKENLTFEITDEILKNDLIINLPILKLDKELDISGASENLLRLLKKESYLSLKYLYNEEKIIESMRDVLSQELSEKKVLNLAEARVIQKKTGYTTYLGLILGSFNPFNLDRVFLEICMTNELRSFFKNIKTEDIPIVGRALKEVQYEVAQFWY